jgi:hypothetical protein
MTVALHSIRESLVKCEFSCAPGTVLRGLAALRGSFVASRQQRDRQMAVSQI